MYILAIEDNRQFLELMRSYLIKLGFTVDTAETVADGLSLAAGGEHDVVLLDLMLPDGDGEQIVKALRRIRNTVPVVVLSARGAVRDRVELLDSGADDYLVKPFQLEELVARLRAVVRRGDGQTEERPTFADLMFDRNTRRAFVDGRPMALRPREAALLELLLARAGEPIDRELSLSNLYSLDEEIGSNVLDVHVHHLRKRLAQAGSCVQIATVRGRGYALRSDDE